MFQRLASLRHVQSRPILLSPRIALFSVLVILGLFALGESLIHLRRYAQFEADGIVAPGVVQSFDRKADVAIITYQDAFGRQREWRLDRADIQLTVGQSLAVRYMHSAPATVELASTSNAGPLRNAHRQLVLGALSALLGMVGIARFASPARRSRADMQD